VDVGGGGRMLGFGGVMHRWQTLVVECGRYWTVMEVGNRRRLICSLFQWDELRSPNGGLVCCGIFKVSS
jgi:hypothetical protein